VEAAALAGVEVAGVEVAGVEVAGVEVAGVEVAGVEVAPVLELPASEPVTVATAELAVDVTELTVEATEPEAGEEADEVGSPEGIEVAACACREKISKATMIPAATSTSCIARRAM
jgi:hypothetical protein